MKNTLIKRLKILAPIAIIGSLFVAIGSQRNEPKIDPSVLGNASERILTRSLLKNTASLLDFDSTEANLDYPFRSPEDMQELEGILTMICDNTGIKNLGLGATSGNDQNIYTISMDCHDQNRGMKVIIDNIEPPEELYAYLTIPSSTEDRFSYLGRVPLEDGEADITSYTERATRVIASNGTLLGTCDVTDQIRIDGDITGYEKCFIPEHHPSQGETSL